MSYNLAMPVTGPTKCPVCNYHLRGLPVPHRCPECAFEYDRHTRIWRPAKPWKRASFLAIVLAVAAFFAWDFVEDLVRGRPPSVSSTLFTAGGLAIIAIVAIRGWIMRKRGLCLALSPAGLFVRTTWAESMIPWNALKDAVPSNLVVHLTRTDGGDSIDVEKLFGSTHEVEEFLRELEAAVTRSRDTATAKDHGPR